MIRDLREASEAVIRIAELRRDLLLLSFRAEAARQKRRIGVALAGVLLLNGAFTVLIAWAICAFYQTGRATVILALPLFLLFAFLGIVCFATAYHGGHEGKTETHETHPVDSSRSA